jgi:hypothetical protein
VKNTFQFDINRERMSAIFILIKDCKKINTISKKHQ